MEYNSESGKFDGGCVSYPWQWPLVSNPYPLEAGNPYRELQMEMEHVPYVGPYDYGWYYPWWGIYPPYVGCPYERTYTWTSSTNSGKCGEGFLKC